MRTANENTPNKENTPIIRTRSKRKTAPDYQAMNEGEHQPRIPKTPTVCSEEYTIGEGYDCIIEKTTYSNNKTVTKRYDIVSLFDKDQKALQAYNKFFNTDIKITFCKPFAINCLIYFLNVKRRNESYDFLGEAARFSYPLQYRVSNEGKESINKQGNNQVSFTDMSS